MMELVTGGSGSGKSAYAENAVCRCRKIMDGKEIENTPLYHNPSLYYIADMFPYGKETEEKIANHRRMRAGKGFQTLEWYQDLEGKLTGDQSPDLSGACVLLECVSNLTANEMYMQGGAGENTVDAVINGIRLLKEKSRHLVVVTNEVFSESEPDSPEMAVYKENLARINRSLAEMADRVTEVIYGIPYFIKGERMPEEKTPEDKMPEDKTPGEKKAVERTSVERTLAGRSSEERISEGQENTRMRLIVGGAFQGKLDYAKKICPDTEWTDGSECELEEIAACSGMNRFHLFVRRWMKAGRTKEELTDAILKDGRELTLICDDVGCGLVPVDAFEREYREAVGRICTEFVRRADRVDRVICGIGIQIK